jgi:hypothetical protein
MGIKYNASSNSKARNVRNIYHSLKQYENNIGLFRYENVTETIQKLIKIWHIWSIDSLIW